MKKTLITLLAMSGVVMGATELPLAVQSGNGDITLSSSADTWSGISVALTLNISTLKGWAATSVGAGHYTLLKVNGGTDANNSTNYNTTLGLVFYKSSADSAKITGLWGSGTSYGAANAPEMVNSNESDFWTNVNSASVVFMHSGGSTDGQVVLTLGYTDNTTTQYSYTLTNFKCGVWNSNPGSKIDVHDTAITGVAVYEGRLTVEEAKLVGTAALTTPPPTVPEPTTATLSLLALCGLAARRRRK